VIGRHELFWKVVKVKTLDVLGVINMAMGFFVIRMAEEDQRGN